MNGTPSDHDLLIEINANLKNLQESYVAHRVQCAAKIGAIDKKADKAHHRIDGLFVSGVLAIVFLGLTSATGIALVFLRLGKLGT